MIPHYPDDPLAIRLGRITQVTVWQGNDALDLGDRRPRQCTYGHRMGCTGQRNREGG